MLGDVRILVVHENRLFREGLSYVLNQQPDTVVVGAANYSDEAYCDLESLNPDLVILDLCLPGRQGLTQTRLIRQTSPAVKILMIGLTEFATDVIACIEAGAAGYVPQDASIEYLLQNVRAVASGEAICSQKVAALLFSRISDAARERELGRLPGLPHLTPRELEIITLIDQDLSNKEIAASLQIQIQTVKNHVHNILEKLGLDGRREVARYARHRRLLMSRP